MGTARAGQIFRNQDGQSVPSLTAAQMLKVDEIAIADFQINILQMMENAGRALADCAIDMAGRSALSQHDTYILVLAGSGGNGGGGMCAARHLNNRGFSVYVILDHPEESLTGAAARQCHTLHAAGISVAYGKPIEDSFSSASLIIDALIGYSLRGSVRGAAKTLVDQCQTIETPILSLDVPSGVNATDGTSSGVYISPDRTLTLALPKRGLANAPGELYLADIGIPAAVYTQIGIDMPLLFNEASWIQLFR